MPLSAPADRRLMHTRQIHCQGFRRADDFWDIEGHITDTKSYSFDNDHRGTIVPGDPLHDMWVRVTLDDRMTIRAVEVSMDKTPYGLCAGITPNFQALVGLRIKGGFTRAVKERLGGVHGCTHVVELMGPIATTAFQTIYPILARERAERAARSAEAETSTPQTGTDEPRRAARRPPPLLNTCHAYASNGALVRQKWPEFYTGSSEATGDAPSGCDPEQTPEPAETRSRSS